MMYEDYFKSVVGGNFKSPEYYNTTYDNRHFEPVLVSNDQKYDYQDDILNLYPDIYKIVMPMIDKMLEKKDINNVDDNKLKLWTLEIYDALEAEDGGIKNDITSKSSYYESETTNANQKNRVAVDNKNSMLRQNVGNNYTNKPNTLNVNTAQNNLEKVNKNEENKAIDVQNRYESRYDNRKNLLLRDLIRIMILNRLFGNNTNRPRRSYPEFLRQNYENTIGASNNINPYSEYLRNKPKTYFDVPYPEEEA